MRLLWSNIKEEGEVESVIMDIRVGSHPPVQIESGILLELRYVNWEIKDLLIEELL